MAPPSLATDNNTCPWCFARLAIQWCKSGANKRKAYLVCEDIDLHPQQEKFWHWWGLEASLRARALLSSTPSPTLGDNNSAFSFASTSASSFTVPSSSSSSSAVAMTTTRPTSAQCRYVGGCKSSRVAPACKSRCCKQHCIVLNNGSCPVKTHDPATMSERQRRAGNVPPPLPERRRALFSPAPAASRAQSPVNNFTPSFLGALDDLAQQQNLEWDYGPALQQARIDSPGVIPSLSPHEAADHEDEELQLALALSLASSPRSSASASSSQVVPPPPSQPRVPASSVARKTTLPKPPRITTQLNPAWMSQAAGTRPANDTFAVRQPSARRAPVDLTTVQRFTLVYWDEDAKPPLILGVTECPSWPEFRLSESTRTLSLLGTDLAAVEYYNVRFCLWTRIDLSYTHILTSDTYLLLRRIGVSGLDEERLIDRFVHLPGPQHIRYNLTAEREAVRHKLKARQTQTTPDEVEIVKVNGIKIEPGTDCPRITRPTLRIVTSSAGNAVTDPICLDDDTTPSSTTSSSPSSLFSTLPSLSSSPTPPTSPFLNAMQSSSEAPSLSATSMKWPAGMYTIDMANGFLHMEATDMQHLPLAQRFQQVFKTTCVFKQRTYSDAQLRWTRGSESLRTAALDAGRTRAGLWSAYAAQVPLKN
ncbi:hypothetical protein MSAN_00954100 [Mycena sanguinolenta]|uniref:Uncharacterized protein n=1 Tax=Mycena sanguinolenta TaxID=230812 RepID=A0A8H7D983_9AGAR|nr:hypothetical protein MSAN_00954100 [Mycena sanguinolenta]